MGDTPIEKWTEYESAIYTFTHTHTESNLPNILININGNNKIHFLTKIIIIQSVIKNVGKQMI